MPHSMPHAARYSVFDTPMSGSSELETRKAHYEMPRASWRRHHL